MGDAGKKQSQIIIYLSRRADGASRILVDSLLLYGDHRAKSADMVDIGALERTEHIARVRRKCFDIASLAFGIDCVKSQR